MKRCFAAQLAEDLGPDDVRLVLSVFEADVARLTAELATSAAADDAQAFRRAAHGLAGAAGAVGADGLEQACRAAMVKAEASAGTLLAEQGAIMAEVDLALVELAAFVRGLDTAGSRQA
jgi:chemotaxis protein histidine kinase CheA